MLEQPLDLLPLWAFFLATCFIVAAPLELGYRLGQRQRLISAGDIDSSVGVIVGAILALLAFLLAFTFNMAASRYEDRRQVVLQEANAVGTTYLRTRLLPEPQRSEIAAFLRQYVDVRLQPAQSRPMSPKDIARVIARSEKIQGRIWEKAMSAADQNPTVMTGLFITSLNEMIDLHSKRILIGARSQIPSMIWYSLLGVAMIGLAAAGFQTGYATTQRSIVIFGLVLVFAGVLTLIADLDHPTKGLLRTTQTPMVDLRKSLTL